MYIRMAHGRNREAGMGSAETARVAIAARDSRGHAVVLQKASHEARVGNEPVRNRGHA